MLKNHVKIALRVFTRNTGFSLLNIAGLATGLTCFVLIALFVRHELSYDRFYPHADRLYRVTMDNRASGRQTSRAASDVAPILRDNFPEFESAARIAPASGGRVVVERDGVRLNESEFFFGEQSVFDVFGYSLAAGDARTALVEPQSIVLSEPAARKYFGSEDPIGASLTMVDFRGQDEARTFTVTGVVRDPEGPTHFRFDFLASYSTLGKVGALAGGSPWIGGGWTYVTLAPGTDLAALEAKVTAFFGAFEGHRYLQSVLGHSRLVLQPVTDIHLRSHVENEIQPTGDIRYVYLLSVIGLLILVVACVNYMNLATSRAAHRAREIGVRKSIGAGRRQISRQMLSESLLFAGLALALSLVLVEIALPYFAAFMDRSISFDILSLAPWLVGITLFVGLFSGLYPAVFLSSLNPVAVLKGGGAMRRDGRLWRSLVVFQFTVSIVLIAATLVVRGQLEYMSTRDVGYERAHVLSIQLDDQVLESNRDVFRDRLVRVPGVMNAAASSNTPVDMGFGPPEEIEVDGRTLDAQRIFVDVGTIETLGIDLVSGRSFSEDHAGDRSGSALVNRSFVEAMAWEDPLGHTVPGTFGEERTIVGVTSDFHYASMYEQIGPAVLTIEDTESFLNTMLVRIASDGVPATLAAVEAVWDEFVPYRAFEFRFLDDDFAAQYRAERRMADFFGIFSFIAILIACLGIVGLAAYIAERRTKEIGIRKVFGASVRGMIGLMTGGFARLVAVAFVIATPLSWLAADAWLGRFAYHMDPGPLLFLASGVLVLAIALASVGWQAVRAATADPVRSLRHE